MRDRPTVAEGARAPHGATSGYPLCGQHVARSRAMQVSTHVRIELSQLSVASGTALQSLLQL